MKGKIKNKFVLKNVGRVIKENKLLSLGLILSIAGAVIFGVLPPIALEKIVNSLSVGEAVGVGLALVYFAFFTLSGVFDALKEVFITIFGQRTSYYLRKDMCAKLYRLPSSYFTENDSGITLSRFVNDTDMLDSLFSSGVISMVVDAVKIISILVLIFARSIGLGIIMIVATPLLILLTNHFRRRMLKAQLANRRAVGTVNNHIPETIKNIRMIHSFGVESFMKKKYNCYLENSYRATEKSNFYDSVYSPIIVFISTFIIALVMVLSSIGGGVREFFGMSVGTAVAVIAFVGKIFSPIESIGMEIQNIQSAAAGIRRIEEFLGKEERKIPKGSVSAEDLENENAVEFKNTDFSYDGENEVLKNFNLSVKKGENVTLMGRTGAGKSTAFKLILGLYSPDCGEVLVCGKKADEIKESEKRKIFGLVEQNFFATAGTVAEQISLLDKEISEEQIKSAARLSGIEDYIMSLENGYETEFHESLFSKGQLQLLAIARAVASNPPILLLDEITANIDSATEEKVIGALIKASKNRTVISISHRLFEKNGGRIIHI